MLIYSRTKIKSPQTNGICERFHRTALNEFYRVAFRKKVYRSIDELQRTWTRGSENTMRHGRIRDVGVSERPRCRHAEPKKADTERAREN